MVLWIWILLPSYLVILDWQNVWNTIPLCLHMAKIKNEYNYSTSIKSNLLFKEESKLQEKKKSLFFFQNTDLFLLAGWSTGYCSH